ncbi:hypothetical protein AJ80_01784 [Polytolypa hystricis UAMH7299]|uniref:Uncharacterized protein n=1 Tax=Polytolypa hystricis (strain UAMH7299) TaxID=1447883 RepID=A0A2B7YZJ1_POLH7|nr:hypothetical protein AJ80_01784 [Polytolypa hystricis UAMH7299]
MSSPIDTLPGEILFQILQEVRLPLPLSSFLPCLLTCREWYDTALPLLCHDIVIRSSNLRAFTKNFPASRSGSLVRSLTICVNESTPNLPPSGAGAVVGGGLADYVLALYGNSDMKNTWSQLRELPHVIAHLTRLTTFSFVVDFSRLASPSWVPRSDIAAILTRLPASCVNLEVDTRTFDACCPSVVHHPGLHLCEVLGTLLPHLHHLRLRLNRLCPALISDLAYQEDSAADINFHSAPHLRTLVISTVTRRIYRLDDTGICMRGHEVYPVGRSYRNALVPLTQLLRRAYLAGNLPAITRLWVIQRVRRPTLLHPQQPQPQPQPQTRTPATRPRFTWLQRHDITNSVVWEIPYHTINHIEDSIEIAPVAVESPFAGSEACVEAVAEDHSWIETCVGARIPTTTTTTSSSPSPSSSKFAREESAKRKWYLPKPSPVISLHHHPEAREELEKQQTPQNMLDMYAFPGDMKVGITPGSPKFVETKNYSLFLLLLSTFEEERLKMGYTDDMRGDVM